MSARPASAPPARSAGGRSPLRILFVNEGDLGGIMGHATVHETLRKSLATLEGVEARFLLLPALGGPAELLTRSFPPLSYADLDLQPVRWHVVQSLRAVRAVRRTLEVFPADALVVDSHAISLTMADEMRRLPTLLLVDATVADFRSLGVWRPVRPWSRASLAPSVALERRAFRLAAGVLAYTAWAKRGVQRANSAANVAVHHPGVDLELFRPAPRRSRERPRVLFVGSNFATKGGHDLLAALAPRLGRDVDLDVVTRDQVPALPGLRVHRLSTRDPELVELFRLADVFCLPTHADIAPLAVIEAMACGAAVVSTRVSGIPELLDGGRVGMLVPPRDPDALSAALARVLGDEAYRAELGGRARARCEERFDARRQARALVERIRELR